MCWVGEMVVKKLSWCAIGGCALGVQGACKWTKRSRSRAVASDWTWMRCEREEWEEEKNGRSRNGNGSNGSNDSRWPNESNRTRTGRAWRAEARSDWADNRQEMDCNKLANERFGRRRVADGRNGGTAPQQPMDEQQDKWWLRSERIDGNGASRISSWHSCTARTKRSDSKSGRANPCVCVLQLGPEFALKYDKKRKSGCLDAKWNRFGAKPEVTWSVFVTRGDALWRVVSDEVEPTSNKRWWKFFKWLFNVMVWSAGGADLAINDSVRHFEWASVKG